MRKVYFGGCGLATIKFVLINRKFIVNIQPLSALEEYSFSIEFDSEQDLESIMSCYRNYEQIIHSIFFNGKLFQLDLGNKKHVRLAYVSMIKLDFHKKKIQSWINPKSI